MPGIIISFLIVSPWMEKKNPSLMIREFEVGNKMIRVCRVQQVFDEPFVVNSIDSKTNIILKSMFLFTNALRIRKYIFL